MGKLTLPPQINGMAELLDLVRDPAKLASYLDQINTAMAELDERLGMLKTADQAQEYLNKAKQLDTDTQAKLISVMKREEEFTAMRNEWRDKLAKARELLGV